MARDVGTFLAGLIIIAVIFVLVNPVSQGPAFVKAIGTAIADMLNAAKGTATGGGGTQTTAAAAPAAAAPPAGAATGTPSRGSVNAT